MNADTYHSRHQGYLGTVVDLAIRSRAPALATRGEQLMIQELERLEAIFNVFDDASEISLLKVGKSNGGPELREVWDMAERWRVLSGGAFSARAGRIMRLWADAAELDKRPDRADLADAVDDLRIEQAEDLGDIRTSLPLDLNAIAKGWIVDKMAGVALASGMIDGITVNAGGDLLHIGEEPLVVGIENPHRPYDNEPPLVRITLQTGAVATSGGARRGWTIDGTWYSHVIDPRTGEPVDHVAQASVVAPHASRADAVATILTVMAPHEGAAFADSLGDVGFMLVGSDGSITKNGYWKSREIN